MSSKWRSTRPAVVPRRFPMKTVGFDNYVGRARKTDSVRNLKKWRLIRRHDGLKNGTMHSHPALLRISFQRKPKLVISTRIDILHAVKSSRFVSTRVAVKFCLKNSARTQRKRTLQNGRGGQLKIFASADKKSSSITVGCRETDYGLLIFLFFFFILMAFVHCEFVLRRQTRSVNRVFYEEKKKRINKFARWDSHKKTPSKMTKRFFNYRYYCLVHGMSDLLFIRLKWLTSERGEDKVWYLNVTTRVKIITIS